MAVMLVQFKQMYTLVHFSVLNYGMLLLMDGNDS